MVITKYHEPRRHIFTHPSNYLVFLSMSWKKYWKTNKRQDGHEPPEAFPRERIMTSRSWRKKYECKANKGDHTFRIVRVSASMEYRIQTPFGVGYTTRRPQPNEEKFILSEGVREDVHWECSACKKREWERLASNPKASLLGRWNDSLSKKMDKHRHSIYDDRI